MAEAEHAVFDEISTPISGVMPDQLPAVWERVEPLFQRVVKPQTGATMESVVHELMHGYLSLWVIGDFQAITCTKILDRPAGRVLWNEWMAGDNMDEWVSDWLKVQEAYARAHECTAIEFAGRIGYLKKYNPQFQEFRAMRTIYRQEL